MRRPALFPFRACHNIHPRPPAERAYGKVDNINGGLAQGALHLPSPHHSDKLSSLRCAKKVFHCSFQDGSTQCRDSVALPCCTKHICPRSSCCWYHPEGSSEL